MGIPSHACTDTPISTHDMSMHIHTRKGGEVVGGVGKGGRERETALDEESQSWAEGTG